VGVERMPLRWWGWSPCPARRSCVISAGSGGRSDSFGGTQQCPQCQQEGMEETPLSSSQGCVVGDQEAVA